METISQSSSDGDIPTPEMTTLTPAQVNIIKESWKIPSVDPVASAEFIFYSFVEQYPHHQAKFAGFKDVPLSELKSTPAFHAHAAKIFGIFTLVIETLDIENDPENIAIKKILAEAGNKHAMRRISKQANNDLRTVLTQIFADACKLDDEGKLAWQKMLDIFFHIFFECLDGRSEQFL